MAALMRECTEKCHSSHLTDLCVSALTKCRDDERIKLLTQLCTNCLKSPSSDGRTLLHLAASLGRTALVEWLIDNDVDLTVCDKESNWTGLHRALFYGHLTTARLLINAESSCLQIRDNEGRTPLDLVIADRANRPSPSPSNELYSWGDNVNFTLGRPSGQQARLNPETVTLEQGHGVWDVVMCKYHTLILTTRGQVLSCGHGWGGRLGHETEATCLTPKLIANLKSEEVISIAASTDHSVFLTAGNSVYACGLNEHNQLGMEGGKILQPRTIKYKLFKEHDLKGVCVGRFHTVVWAPDALFTFGLNAGQLGHHVGDTYQATPRLVSGINYKTMTLEKVASSDAAILCHTKQGELLLISEFRVRKIASNWNIDKLLVLGGKLDHRNDLEALKEFGGCEVNIGVLNHERQLYLWRHSDPTLRRVNYPGYPWLSPRDFQMSKNCLLIASEDGQVFTAALPAERRKFGAKKKKETLNDPLSMDFQSISLSDLCRGDDTCYVELERVRSLHRTVSVFMDRKGQNFMAVQCLPNDNLTLVPEVSPSEMTSHIRQLYAETESEDLIHDVILEGKNLHLPAHQLILSSQCTYFYNLFKGENAASMISVDVTELGNSDLISQTVQFIYTGTCDLLKPGTRFKFTLQPLDTDKNHLNSSNEVNTKGKSAYSVRKSMENEMIENTTKPVFDGNPVKMLKEMAKSLGVKMLLEKLDHVTWQDGKICLKDKWKKSREQISSFNRRKMSHLFDIKLESEDGQIFNCHRCILTARMEYFHSMLTSGWLETSQSENVTLPVIGPIFNVIVQYLYTDDSTTLRASNDVEFLCNVLVAADQLLIIRLKDICEVVICQHLSLKNVAELIEFSSVYNAEQLKLACQQFICLNLTALLEAHALDFVSEEVMDTLSEFYRSFVPAMCRRLITPYDEPPALELLENLELNPTELAESKSDSSVARVKPKRRRSSKSTSESKRDSISEATVEVAEIEVEVPDSPRGGSTEPEVTSPKVTLPASPNTKWPITPTSPSGDAFNLRGIMEEEALQSRDALPDRSAPTGRKKKLSQKDRKRMAHESHVTETPKPVEPPKCPWKTPTSPTTAPWASTAPVPAPSFRDLMLSDERQESKPIAQKIKLRTPQKGSTKTNISWGLPQRGRGETKSEEPITPPIAERPNPWTPLTADPNTSFNEIVEKEISEKVTLDKTSRKALNLIQTEEQAISELMAYYKERNSPDVKISVERMTKTAARPTWAAKQ